MLTAPKHRVRVETTRRAKANPAAHIPVSIPTVLQSVYFYPDDSGGKSERRRRRRKKHHPTPKKHHHHLWHPGRRVRSKIHLHRPAPPGSLWDRRPLNVGAFPHLGQSIRASGWAQTRFPGDSFRARCCCCCGNRPGRTVIVKFITNFHILPHMLHVRGHQWRLLFCSRPLIKCWLCSSKAINPPGAER